MTNQTIKDASNRLFLARKNAEAIPPLTKSLFTDPDSFSLDQAYEVQRQGIALRLAEGDQLAGLKMGLTSRAKMEQMGLKTPIYGVLLKSMKVQDSLRYFLTGKIHPKAEPEIALVTSKELKGEVSFEETEAACGQVVPAIEILDSRYTDFKYFSLPDVVADNSSSCDFILGSPVAYQKGMLLAEELVSFYQDGKLLSTAKGGEALGHPIESLREQVRLLWQYEKKSLPAGTLVLTGALTAATPLSAGAEIVAEFSSLGKIVLKVEAP